MMNKYILAIYDIRGKQEYIYRSNKIKEIIGGSAIIRDCFTDYLFPAAKAYMKKQQGTAIYRYQEQEPFRMEEFINRMNSASYIGEVVYEGGGNFFVLYKDKETCLGVNRLFSKNLLERTHSLKVLCTYIEGVDFSDFVNDQKKIYEMHRKNEALNPISLPAQILPFTQIDRQTSMPLYKSHSFAYNKKVSKESYQKYQKYVLEQQLPQDNIGFNERSLDTLVTKKGEESLLAVVYIDGNNMGAKVQECLRSVGQDYDASVSKLREFSAVIHKNYITDRILDIQNFFNENGSASLSNTHGRLVIAAGDEITFICNARDAYQVAKTYLDTLPEGCSACAGIAIFHSHAPFADAYRIAEECCESGKRVMKQEKLSDANFLDVQYCQGAMGTDLETIRKKEVGTLTSKPWCMTEPVVPKDTYVTIQDVEEMVDQLNQMARTNVKELAGYAKKSLSELKVDLKRIKAHTGIEIKIEGTPYRQEQLRRIIYDISILYDLWFDRRESQ